MIDAPKYKVTNTAAVVCVVLLTFCAQAIAILGALFLLSGCNAHKMMDKLAAQFSNEITLARTDLDLLRARELIDLESRIDPANQDTKIKLHVQQAASVFPGIEPTSVELVGFHWMWFSSKIVTASAQSQSYRLFDITYQYQFERTYILANIVLKEVGGNTYIAGLHVLPLVAPLQVINRFSLKDKTAAQYVLLAVAVFIPTFSLYTLVVCYRTSIGRRKWLWLLFIAFGFTGFAVNWTTGIIQFTPWRSDLLGAGFFRDGLYGPWILSVSIPFGAIAYLLQRKARVDVTEQQEPAKQIPLGQL